MEPNPAGLPDGDSLTEERPYTPQEREALHLAERLRKSIARERATVRRLKTFLDERRDEHS